MEITPFLKKLKVLELNARKNVFSILAGDYSTILPGKGSLFKEARKYIYGESIRLIDWNMTARLGEPYVKIYQEERERDIYIALDISPSMYTGWQERNKIEFAAELAGSIAYSAEKGRDKFGLIYFDDKAELALPPSSGRVHLYKTLRSLVNICEKRNSNSSLSDIRQAIHRIQKSRKSKYVIFIISDFFDYDIPDDLKYIREAHDVNLLHIYDPMEYYKENGIRFFGRSPEGKSSLQTVFMDKLPTIEKMEQFLRAQTEIYRIYTQSISTRDDIGIRLKEFFSSKRSRAVF